MEVLKLAHLEHGGIFSEAQVASLQVCQRDLDYRLVCFLINTPNKSCILLCLWGSPWDIVGCKIQ